MVAKWCFENCYKRPTDWLAIFEWLGYVILRDDNEDVYKNLVNFAEAYFLPSLNRNLRIIKILKIPDVRDKV